MHQSLAHHLHSVNLKLFWSAEESEVPSVDLFMERSVEIKCKSSASGKMALNQSEKSKNSLKSRSLLSVSRCRKDYPKHPCWAFVL